MDSGHDQVAQGPGSFDFAPILHVFMIGKRLALGLTVVMFYDLLLASPDLYASFVSSRWSLGRVLFFLNRLVTPVMMLIHTLSMIVVNPAPWVCAITPWTLMLGNWLVVFCLGVGLIARIHALWQRRWVLIGSIAAFAFIYGGNLIYASYITSKSNSVPSPFPPPFTGCFWTFNTSSIFWLGFVTTGAWETICVVLTTWKAWRVEEKRESPILHLIFVDGILYYISVILLKGFTIITSFYAETSPFGASNAILALTSLLCTQLFLRLRSAADKSPSWMCNTPPMLSKSRSRSSQRSTEEERYYWAFEKPLPPVPVHISRV
ncbi:hypothetical protein M408DRAFT_330821 [Serendipita vermifera MAFF 305830]|uniref:Uncharacterized protein n=1 Tax=Serendipita vermifera MAFF 305830 TaxID=933852 RepID=A0A0C2WI49_SERVB|nr:hypothetical protein M408DRAFT_330821 [Serendipita vermifera MAFF 305830]